MHIKSYYDFMLFNTVCFSFKGFNCVIQKLEDTKNSWKLFRPKEIVEVFRNLKKMAQTFANTTQKLEFCQISNPTK